MKYGDFSSLVQLGVGLHVGTAILQLYGDLGVQPLVRAIARIKNQLEDSNERTSKDLKEKLNRLESDFEIFKIQLFNEFRMYIKINSVFAAVLAIVLTFISYKTDDTIAAELTVFITAISVLPAPLTLAALWKDAARVLAPIKKQADDLESQALRA